MSHLARRAVGSTYPPQEWCGANKGFIYQQEGSGQVIQKNGGRAKWTNEGQSDDEPIFFFLILLYRYIEVYIIQLTQQYITLIISEQI